MQKSSSTIDASSAHPTDLSNWLLQVPATALHLVLQKLDQHSLACTAVTCSALSKAAPATTRLVSITSDNTDTIDSFSSWLQRHSTRLASLQLCSILWKGT